MLDKYKAGPEAPPCLRRLRAESALEKPQVYNPANQTGW